MFVAPWIAIFLAAPLTWLSALRWPALCLLVIAYGAALADGQLGAIAAISLALLLIAAWAASPRRKMYCQYLGHALFIMVALSLFMHWLPGFHNPRVIGPVRFTPDAAPFTMYLNLDKPLIGFWLLLALPWTRSPRDVPTALKAGAWGMLLTTIACLLVALLVGLVRYEPKLPPMSWLWLLNNLLLVTLTEEALFRGYLQGGLSRLLRGRAYADVSALAISAALFGLAHVAGGWQWIVVGSVAGLGYGLAFRFGGLRASVLAHFGLNVTHFFLFTYPMLAAS